MAAVNRGVAYESDLLVVKMGIPRQDSFPRTTELMQGVDYLVRQALAMGRPMVINLSFGNNYGIHTEEIPCWKLIWIAYRAWESLQFV